VADPSTCVKTTWELSHLTHVPWVLKLLAVVGALDPWIVISPLTPIPGGSVTTYIEEIGFRPDE